MCKASMGRRVMRRLLGGIQCLAVCDRALVDKIRLFQGACWSDLELELKKLERLC